MKPSGRFADLRRLTGDAGLVTLGQLISYAYPIVSIPLLSRVLGIDGLGVFIVILATIQMLLVLTDFGFGFSALRRISVATSPQERQQVVSSTITAKLALWAAGAVVLLVVVLIVPSMLENLVLYVIGILLTVGAVFYPMWYLQGVGRLKLFALLTAGSRLVALAGLVLTVHSADDVALAVVWQFAPFLLSAVVFWIVLIAQRELRLRLSRPVEARAAVSDSVPLFINLISGQVIVNSSAILLGQLAGYRQVGLFGPADRLTSAIHGVLVAVEQAMMPRVAAAHTDPTVPSRRRAIMVGLIGCYALSGGLLALSAPWLIPWYLGDGFAEAIPVVQLMGLATMLSGVTRTFILDLVSAGRSRICSIVTMTGAGWHVLTATIGAWGWGAVGVAVAVCGTQLVMGASVVIADLRGPRRPR
ncbi:MAG TPA: lipopolysaccharide biosynthesis protein [Microlunatus sp.]